jgi:hypothetical protein
MQQALHDVGAIEAPLRRRKLGFGVEPLVYFRPTPAGGPRKPPGWPPESATQTNSIGPNALVERLHDPAVNEGFTPSTDYRVDRLGARGGDHGALYIEGGTYCPATPEPLQNATKELLGAIIDTDTYRERIKSRKAFQLLQKEKPDAKGRAVLRCPALGPSPTVTCPLRELLKTVADKVRPAVDGENLPDMPDSICQKHSVSFDTARTRRDAQAFEYGTWDEFHTHARNSIESLNH